MSCSKDYNHGHINEQTTDLKAFDKRNLLMPTWSKEQYHLYLKDSDISLEHAHAPLALPPMIWKCAVTTHF